MDSLTKTKIKLLAKSPFIATVGLACKHSMDENVPTACTDGVSIKYGTKFWNKLDSEEQIGLMAHEIWHIVLSHMHRRGDRSPKRWNVAGDHVINLMLKSQGYTLPAGGLADPQYMDLDTDSVYEKLPDETEDSPEYGDGDWDDLEEPAEGDKQAAELATKEILAKAVQSARMTKDYGSLPENIKRLLDDTLQPKISWQQLLINYMTEKAKDDYSWQRPNRRFRDIYLPSLYSEAMGELVVAIDTSGSVDDTLVNQFLVEVKALHEDVQPSKTTILAIDTQINGKPYTVSKDEQFIPEDVGVEGGGGTDFLPAFNYTEDNPTQCLIYLTDGYANTDLEEPNHDVLWLIYDNNNFTSPFGTVIYVD